MANAIVEITTQLLSTDPPRDWCTNTLHFTGPADPVSDAQFLALTDAIRNTWFATSGTYQRYGTSGGKVVAYKQSDPLPRPERSASMYTPTTWATGVFQPRQVSLVVSMFAGRNLRRSRGRIYLPPNSAWSLSDRPSTALQTSALGTLTAISAAAVAVSPAWVLSVYSAADNQYKAVTDTWCNDTWDIQRRRGLRESARQTHHF